MPTSRNNRSSHSKKAATRSTSSKSKAATPATSHKKAAIPAASAASSTTTANPLRVAANETFSVQQEASQLRPGYVSLYVNGSSRGEVNVAGRKLREFVIDQARSAGMRSCSVYVDGNKVTTDAADAALDSTTSPISKIEIVAKDTRA